MVIIMILLSMLMPALMRAYRRAKDMADEWNASDVAEMLCKESRAYCVAHSQFLFTNRSDFANQCRLAPYCRDWVFAPSTDFVPFGHLDPTNKTVISVHLGRNNATLYSFTVGDLSIYPQR